MQRGNRMFLPEKIDLHIHTTVSDGTDTPEEILCLVKNAGIQLFSITDHDAVKAGAVIRKIRKEGDPAFVTGTEFSCKDEHGKYHILGYGYDLESPAIRALVKKSHGYRMDKVIARLDFLRNEFGFTFPEKVIEKLLALDNPGKPHIGNLMVKYGYAKSKDTAIDRFVNKCSYKSKYLTPKEAIEGIREGGGISILAHPAFGNGEEMILGQEMSRRLDRLIGFGLRGVEAYYSKNTEIIREEMLAFAEEKKLLITAGSDYHGGNKSVRLGESGCWNAAQGPDGLRRFMEEIQDKILL